MNHLKSFLFLLAFYACQEPSSSSGHTESPPDTGTENLLYISSRGQGFDIYKNDISGEKEQQFTKDAGWEWRPQFNKKEKLIIFNSQDTSGNFQMRARGLSGKEVSFDTYGLPEFTISPDGKWLAYTRKNGEATHLILAPYQSIQDSVTISFENSYNGRPVWANTKNQLAFLSDRTGSNEIFLYYIDGKQTQQITDNQLQEKYISWSPNDQQIATTMRGDSTENDIYLIDLATSKQDQVTNTPSINESEIAWSPKGRYIAYHAKVEEKDDIFLLDLSTKEIIQITNGEGYHGEPSWYME